MAENTVATAAEAAEDALRDCRCIAEIDAKLAPDHSLNCTLSFRAGEVGRPIINLIRRDTWKPETRRNKASFFVASFCPFCGQSYARSEA